MKKYWCIIAAGAFLLGGCLHWDGREDALPASSEAAPPPFAAQGAASSALADGAGTAAQPASFQLVVPEGYTLARIGMTLEEKGVCTAAEFIAAAQSEDFSAYPLLAQQAPDENRCFGLEGYLFPATYQFGETAAPAEILRTMVQTLEERMTEALRGQIASSGLTVDETLTLASMVEKESYGVEVMPLVSSVFHNRLAQGMQLQSDVTITYVEGAIKPFITGDIDRYNEYYNTYKCPGLPAGPICNPGMAAIQAAVSPAATDYLYFVTDSSNAFYFAATYEEHQTNIEQIKAAGLWA